MCGIAGFIDPSLRNKDAEKMISSMLGSISHRGPDASLNWIRMPVVLGHNRLSIIDLSEDGNQPMHHFDSAIIFNGEIYNYIEVRDELIQKGYKFKTQSDTEVILAAYREWGRNSVNKFVGMWAFALWDKLNGELFCSRDRFGIKPFYYIHDGDRFYFGSEYKVLKQTPVFSNEINLDQVSRGLQLGWVCYDDETYFSKVKSLPAACNLLYNNGNVKVERYWDIDLNRKFNGTESEKREAFKNLFIDSVKLHMRADVEVGGCLSGGLDSSSIASAVAKLFPETNFKTFTIFYDGKNEVDERPWVQEVLKEYGTLKNYTYSPNENLLSEILSKVLYHAEVPIAGSSPISQYFVMQLASQHKIKVLLDGQGSDEYLAGYMHSFYRLMGGMMKRMQLFSAGKELISHARMQNFSFAKNISTIGKSLLAGIRDEESLYRFEFENYYPYLSNEKSNNIHLNSDGGSRLNQFLYNLTFNTSLPSLLHYEDRNSMAFSIESRVPFLDHRLVEFVFSVDDSDKFHLGITKKILRDSLQGLVPTSILQRKDKKGFVTPGEVKWLRNPLKQLLEINYAGIDFLAEKKVRSVIEDFKAGNNKNASLVWRIAMLDQWMKLN
jgi:asparagine synthase (glutamine-hydrolysing)